MVAAGSANVPLLGKAMRSTAPPCWYCGGVLQELVHVLEPGTAADHEDLQPVQQLRDFLPNRFIALVLGGEPHLARLFEDLLALCMDARVECGDRCRACWTRRGLLAQLGEQLVERLHRSSPLTASSLMGRVLSDGARPVPCCTRRSSCAERNWWCRR